jgi:hypothetical protein
VRVPRAVPIAAAAAAQARGRSSAAVNARYGRSKRCAGSAPCRNRGSASVPAARGSPPAVDVRWPTPDVSDARYRTPRAIERGKEAEVGRVGFACSLLREEDGLGVIL